MRIMAIFLFPLALAACQSEPDFETRYEKANAEIAAKVKALDEAAKEAEANAMADEGVADQPKIIITKDGKRIEAKELIAADAP